MTTTTTQAVQRRLAEIREREQKAGAETWTLRDTNWPEFKLFVRGDPFRASTQLPTNVAEFCVEARADIPALLDLVEALLEEREAARGKAFNRCEYERSIASTDAALARFAGEE